MHNFHEVIPGKLYRCGSPTPLDVKHLSEKFGIKKIVSLDLSAANKINLACALFDIEHLIFPIDIEKKITLLPFIKNIPEIFLLDKPTLIHCVRGCDRTGMAIAIYRCKYQKWPFKKALTEAYEYGFGLGLPTKITKLFTNIIKDYCSNKDIDEDINEASDIVDGSRDEAYDPYYGSASHNLSWSPFADYSIKEWPFANTEMRNPEQEYATREDYGLDDSEFIPKDQDFPQIGMFNDYGPTIQGLGPSALSDWSV